VILKLWSDVKFGLSGGIVELIFKRYLKTILKRSPRIGIGFVSPFIALKIPYDQSTETKTHMEAEIKLSKLLIIRPSEMKVSVIPNP
jgi:hypothetical protein